MDALAYCPQRAIKGEPLLRRPPCRLGHRCVLLGLLGALGALAFIFSAISPDDDDIQQVRYALAPPTLQIASFYVTARVSVPDDEIKSRVCSSRAGNRSPPSRPS
jgi:hypothetical protein